MSWIEKQVWQHAQCDIKKKHEMFQLHKFIIQMYNKNSFIIFPLLATQPETLSIFISP
jgi:hypothetical protein